MNSNKTLFCKKDCRRFYVNMTTMAIKKETRKGTNKNLYNSRNHKSAD